jgi:hypothetical protein
VVDEVERPAIGVEAPRGLVDDGPQQRVEMRRLRPRIHHREP